MKTLLAIIAAASLVVGCGVIEEEQTTTDTGARNVSTTTTTTGDSGSTTTTTDFGGGESSRRSSNRGNDLRYDVSINLEEAYKGLEKNVKYTTYKKCSTCSGSGAAKGSKPVLVQSVRSALKHRWRMLASNRWEKFVPASL